MVHSNYGLFQNVTYFLGYRFLALKVILFVYIEESCKFSMHGSSCMVKWWREIKNGLGFFLIVRSLKVFSRSKSKVCSSTFYGFLFGPIPNTKCFYFTVSFNFLVYALISVFYRTSTLLPGVSVDILDRVRSLLFVFWKDHWPIELVLIDQATKFNYRFSFCKEINYNSFEFK